MDNPSGVVGGYRQSKWVSEQLVLQAHRRGIPVKIFRPGNVTGAQSTAVGAHDTIINALVKGCIELGAAFEFDVWLLLVPVDFVASTIVSHVRRADADGAIVNMPGARRLPWAEFISMVTELGYDVPLIPYEQWYAKFSVDGTAGALAPYRPLFGPHAPAPELGVDGNRPEIDTTTIDSAVDGPRCADIDQELMRRYLDHLIEVGYLRPPTGADARETVRSGA